MDKRAEAPKETLAHRIEDALDPSHPHSKEDKEHAAAHRQAVPATEMKSHQPSEESKEPPSAVVTGAAYGGIFGAAGGAVVDHYKTKGEVAALEQKAKAARDAKDEQEGKLQWTDESTDLL